MIPSQELVGGTTFMAMKTMYDSRPMRNLPYYLRDLVSKIRPIDEQSGGYKTAGKLGLGSWDDE